MINVRATLFRCPFNARAFKHNSPAQAHYGGYSQSTRGDFLQAKRIMVKLGSQIVTRSNGSGIAFARLSNVVEQLAQLRMTGRDVILVSSGAVAAGRHRLRHLTPEKEALPIPSRPLLVSLPGTTAPVANTPSKMLLPTQACAASGQSGLMAIYEWMFAQYSIDCAQVLVSQADLAGRESRERVMCLVEELLAAGLIPIINENDAIYHTPQAFEPSPGFVGDVNLEDNDGIASLLSVASGSDLLMLMSNVDGVYSSDPKADSSAKRLQTYETSTSGVDLTGRSLAGRGGMASKVSAAKFAASNGVNCLIASGIVDVSSGLHRTILDAVEGHDVGTYFPAEEATQMRRKEEEESVEEEEESVAAIAKEGGNLLRQLSSSQRSMIIERLAELLIEEEAKILEANQKDIDAAKNKKGLSESLFSRLKLSSEKLQVLATGLRQIAAQTDVLGRTISRTEIATDTQAENSGPPLILVKETVPIGTLLIIFESRPDVLPQVAALAIASGNGLVLKGGTEATHSNRMLYGLVQRALKEAVQEGDGGHAAACQLIQSREDVSKLLGLDHLIDLVIPRGSNELVQSIKQNTQIPVLGHADGICHAYVDKFADPAKTLRILRDSKCDYPAACNAIETVLVHRDLCTLGPASGAWTAALNPSSSSSKTDKATTGLEAIVSHLNEHGVKIYAGPKLAELLAAKPFLLQGESLDPAESMQVEYGTLTCAVEVVDDVLGAVGHVRENGSGHTELIITEDQSSRESFMSGCDSACVFHNASSRFSDGFRFGLGAEVGISTSRIHARGPVGIEGLLSTTFKLHGNGHTVESIAEGQHAYTHKTL